MSFYDWWYQHQIYGVMFTTLGESSNSSQHGLGPSDELCQLAFKQNAPTEVQCIDPALLELASSEQPVGEDGPFRPFLLDHAVGWRRETGQLVPDTRKNPESTMNVDEGSPETAEVPLVVETDEEFFERPEVRELVNIHDGPVIPEAPPPIPEADDVEDSIIVSYHPPLSPRLSYLLSSALPQPVPFYTENGVEFWLVERIIQAQGPHDDRQYLIRWEGCGPEFDSWEPAVHVCEELKADFERSRLHRRLSEETA
jgi:hypothetical protein